MVWRALWHFLESYCVYTQSVLVMGPRPDSDSNYLWTCPEYFPCTVLIGTGQRNILTQLKWVNLLPVVSPTSTYEHLLHFLPSMFLHIQRSQHNLNKCLLNHFCFRISYSIVSILIIKCMPMLFCIKANPGWLYCYFWAPCVEHPGDPSSQKWLGPFMSSLELYQVLLDNSVGQALELCRTSFIFFKNLLDMCVHILCKNATLRLRLLVFIFVFAKLFYRWNVVFCT